MKSHSSFIFLDIDSVDIGIYYSFEKGNSDGETPPSEDEIEISELEYKGEKLPYLFWQHLEKSLESKLLTKLYENERNSYEPPR